MCTTNRTEKETKNTRKRERHNESNNNNKSAIGNTHEKKTRNGNWNQIRLHIQMVLMVVPMMRMQIWNKRDLNWMCAKWREYDANSARTHWVCLCVCVSMFRLEILCAIKKKRKSLKTPRKIWTFILMPRMFMFIQMMHAQSTQNRIKWIEREWTIEH